MATYEGIDTLKLGNDTLKLGTGNTIDIDKLLNCLYRPASKSVTGYSMTTARTYTTITASAPCRVRFEFLAIHMQRDTAVGTYYWIGTLGKTKSESYALGQDTIGANLFVDTYPHFLQVLSSWEFTEDYPEMWICTTDSAYYAQYEFRPVSILPPDGVSLDDFDPDSIKFTVTQE